MDFCSTVLVKNNMFSRSSLQTDAHLVKSSSGARRRHVLLGRRPPAATVMKRWGVLRFKNPQPEIALTSFSQGIITVQETIIPIRDGRCCCFCCCYCCCCGGVYNLRRITLNHSWQRMRIHFNTNIKYTNRFWQSFPTVSHLRSGKTTRAPTSSFLSTFNKLCVVDAHTQ